MNKKFDYILLPPDGFHQCFDDLLSKSFETFSNLERKINELSKKEKKLFVVKYRTKLQRDNFPSSHNYLISYGNLISLCHKKTKIIGPCGPAMMEILKDDYEYNFYDFFQAYKKNRMIHNNFEEILFISKNIDNLIDNITNLRKFKKGFFKKDLMNVNGHNLEDIIENIYSEKKS